MRATSSDPVLSASKAPFWHSALVLQLLQRHVRLEADEIVVKEGELSREIYVVLDGSAEVYVKWTLPDRTLVGTVSKGAIFGEIEMLAHIDNPECKFIILKLTTVFVAFVLSSVRSYFLAL